MLDLKWNSFIGDEGAMHLAKCIDHIEELILNDCNIGTRGVESLSQAIMQRKLPVNMKLILLCFYVM